MTFILKDTVWPLLGFNIQGNDSAKDSNNKGIWQRYNEAMLTEYDDSFHSLIEDFTKNTQDPESVLVKFMPYLEQLLGTPYQTSDEALRRKLIRYSIRFNQIKGTKRGVELLIKNYIGKDVTITEHLDVYGFDSSTTLDSDVRTLDSAACGNQCTEYSVIITGVGSITSGEIDKIFDIITNNQPIDTRLRTVTYNGAEIDPYLIDVNITADGDLEYDRQFDPDLTLTLTAEGDLTVEGIRESRYSINADGDLIYTP